MTEFKAKIFFPLLFVVAAFSGTWCAPQNEGGQGGGCICNLLYDPVCGENGLTYGNSCGVDCESEVKPDNPEV